jgi:hypothetical protein
MDLSIQDGDAGDAITVPARTAGSQRVPHSYHSVSFAISQALNEENTMTTKTKTTDEKSVTCTSLAEARIQAIWLMIEDEKVVRRIILDKSFYRSWYKEEGFTQEHIDAALTALAERGLIRFKVIAGGITVVKA